MRKLLLLGLAMGLGTLVMAQNAANQIENSARKQMQAVAVEDAAPMANPVQYQGPMTPKGITEVEPIALFSSVNVFSLLVQEQTCMTYNQDIDGIMFTARGHTGVLGTGNDVCTATSVDGGATFVNGVTAGPPSQGNNRYPSGAIYNPAGNADPANAFKVTVAPITGGSGWLGNDFATNNWANSDPYNQFRQASPSGDLLLRGGLDVDGNGYAQAGGVEYVSTGAYAQGFLFKGTFDAAAGGYNFTDQMVAVPWRINPADNTYEFSTFANVAFSPDGSIGYALFTGADSRADANDLTGYQPIIFKTTDMGATWELMAMLDLTNRPEMIGMGLMPNGLWERVWPLRRTWSLAEPIFKPWFSETDIVVDYNGNLHIMALCQGTYSDHTDSLGYTFTYDKGALFEIYNVEQGDEWLVRFIDTLDTRDVAAEESGYGAGTDAQGWDMRLQASRTADGKNVFAVWTDTDVEFFGEEINLYPDVRAWGHRVDVGLFSDVVDFTNQGATYGENYFMFVSPTAIMTADGKFEIPVSKSDIRTTNDPGQAVYHAYLKGIVFDPATDFPFGVGVEQVDAVSDLTAYPNPVNSELTIAVNLNKAANLSVEMTNLLGQNVYTLKAKGVTGENLYKVNVANMQAGIYFYSVTVEGQKTTRKVVVK